MSRPRLCACGGCPRCRRRAHQQRWRDKNPDYGDRYLRRGQAIIEAAKASPCADCATPYPHYVMDFDHVRGVKLFTIGSMSRATNVERLRLEIAKCDVVCSNCHRERTWLRSGGYHRANEPGGSAPCPP